MWPGARTPPTEPLNSVSPVNSACSRRATSSETIPAVWPGVCSGSIRRPPVRTGSPGTSSPVAGRDQLALARVDQDRRAGMALEHLVQRADVVVVVVREQHVREREVVALERVEQRRDRAAGVDQHSEPPGSSATR